MAQTIVDVRRAILHLFVLLCPHLVITTTRYLPSSPWSSLSSSLSLPPPSSSSSSSVVPDSKLTRTPPREKATKLTSSRSPSSLAVKAVHRDLSRLSRLLPGVYTNMQRYQRDADRPLPLQQRQVLLRSSYRPVILSFQPQAFAVLVQDYSGDSLFPFRQRVYTFSVDLANRAIRMKVWNFASKRAEKKVTRDLHRFRKLREKDLLSQDSCDMLWRRLGRSTFMGITGKQCMGYVQGEQVRITVSMTLTSQLLQTHEGWYRMRDGKKLVEMDIPYNLLKTKSFSDSRLIKGDNKKAGKKSHVVGSNSTQNDIPRLSLTSHVQARRRTGARAPSVDPAAGHSSKSVQTGQVKSSVSPKEAAQDPLSGDKDKEWILADFQALAEALLSGQLVFYSVELTACSLPAQLKLDRLSFGDFVDSFESLPRDGQRDFATIRFWQTKFVQGDEGVETLTREITVKSNGRVLVRLHRKSTDTNRLSWDQTAHCKLYDPESGLGGVKLTSKPLRGVREIGAFGKFRSSLRHGRHQVRMIVDLTQCAGRSHGVRSIIGTTVRAYDFINQGKAIEVTHLTPDSDQAHFTLLTGHFLNNGEVNFITSLQPQAGSDVDRNLPGFHQDWTYQCALSGSDVSNDNGPRGVRLFYTT